METGVLVLQLGRGVFATGLERQYSGQNDYASVHGPAYSFLTKKETVMSSVAGLFTTTIVSPAVEKTAGASE